MPLGQDHRTTEEHLRESGVPAVILRNGWYIEIFTDQLETYRRSGALIGAAGKARIAPTSRADLAAAAVSALLDNTVDTATYELAGLSVTFPEIADALSKTTGQELPYRDVTLEEYRGGLLADGLDEATAGFVTALEAGMANGDLDSDSTDLERLLGRPATDLHTALTDTVGQRYATDTHPSDGASSPNEQSCPRLERNSKRGQDQGRTNAVGAIYGCVSAIDVVKLPVSERRVVAEKNRDEQRRDLFIPAKTADGVQGGEASQPFIGEPVQERTR